MTKETYKPKYDSECGRRLLQDVGYNEDYTSQISPQEIDTTIDSLIRSAGLRYQSREVIKLRRGLGDSYLYTLEEVGHIFKVTQERIRQVEARAIRKLRAAKETLEDSAGGR